MVSAVKVSALRFTRYALEQGHAMRRGEIDATTLLPQFIDKPLLQN